jgi:creatinine amidohydrolase/Fe(II)-dependent formamide hydrolase-like protein
MSDNSAGTHDGPVLARTLEIARMSHREVPRARDEANGVVLLPLGATEQHGPHLPLNVDTLIAEHVAHGAAERARVVVAPALPFGNSRQNMGFAGTMTLGTNVMQAVVKDLCLSLNHHGFDKLVVVNGHGGNVAPIASALEEVHYETGALTAHVRCWELDGYEPPPNAPAYEGHAGRIETEVALALAPADVNSSAFVLGEPTFELGPLGSLAPVQYGPMASAISFFGSAWESSEHGHYGDPAAAEVERGRTLLEAWVDRLAEVLESIKAGTVGQSLRADVEREGG